MSQEALMILGLAATFTVPIYVMQFARQAIQEQTQVEVHNDFPLGSVNRASSWPDTIERAQVVS